MDPSTRSPRFPSQPDRRFRFEEFVVSTGRRALLRDGREVPLIPRYFDLLVLLLSERHRAVRREEILDAVWSDVIVSDGALSQAVRTLRRALVDTAREPRFIRTVARHGYRFVHDGVIEEADAAADGNAAAAAATGAAPATAPADADPFEAPLRRLLDGASEEGATPDEVRLEAAEALHALGTEEALRRIDRLPGHARARAAMREARWEVPGAGVVPLLGPPGWPASVAYLVALRVRGAARLVAMRWWAAAVGGAIAGAVAGFLGGAVLRSGPGIEGPPGLPVTLALLGFLLGGVAAAGVGVGLVFAEAVARSQRAAALVVCGALAGGLTGTFLHLAASGFLVGMFGQDLPMVGGLRGGLLLGAAAGLGYALSTPRPQGGGMATPHGRARAGAALLTGLTCALAGILLCRLGFNLAGTTLNLLAHTYAGSHVGLDPLARMVGEADPGPLTRGVSCGLEGFFFGAGLAAGLTRRPSR
ncbi:MAG TPA: transcriptional regulator [Candidatus Cryosericum sp.]|nr:transcriptional regulator [Candidatus Cryosericum sp.]